MEKLSQHLQNLEAWADSYAAFSLEDKFPPQLTPDDGTLVASLHSRSQPALSLRLVLYHDQGLHQAGAACR